MKTAGIVIAGLFFLFASPAQAQWNVGGLIGVNLASVSVDPEPSSESYSSRMAFGLGAVVDRPLTDQIDLHAEPMYLQKGGKIEEGNAEATFKTSYFEIPVLARYNFRMEGSVSPYAMAGPSIGFLLGSKFDIKDGPEIDNKDETKSLDLGLAFGGGASMPRGNMTLFAEARYVLGLANTNDDESDETTVKNRGIQVLVGATVPLNR